MKCIFCLQDRASSIDHVFPLAIGGRLTTDRVCEPCNSTLGSRIDSVVSDNFVIRMRRSQLGLAGNSGKAPPIYEMLLGTHKLPALPEARVHVTFNEKTGKMDTRIIPHVSDITLPDGTMGRRIVVDGRDRDKLPNIMQRERKRHGMRPFSPEELVVELRKFPQESTSIENPTIHVERSHDFSYLRHGMIKIAYELAFLWLGESYLDDPSAAELRAAICDPDKDSTNKLAAIVADPADIELFDHWAANKNHHLAFVYADEQGVAIGVRVFDIHAALVWVTKDAAKYLKGRDANSKIRFLSIDPVSGDMMDTPLMSELLRIAKTVGRIRNSIS